MVKWRVTQKKPIVVEYTIAEGRYPLRADGDIFAEGRKDLDTERKIVAGREHLVDR